MWLTHLKLSDKTTIEGQADNLESVYAFFRSIKDYNPDSDIKLQKLGLAAKSSPVVQLEEDSNSLEEAGLDTDSVLTSLNADFYEFRISNEPVQNAKSDANKNSNNAALPGLEPINE